MKILIVTYHDPYDGGDVVWNAMRIAAFQRGLGDEVAVFLLGDAVMLVHKDIVQPEDAVYDVRAELAAALRGGASAKACGTCLKNRALAFEGVQADVAVATLKDLADWLHWADRVLTF